MNPRVVIIGHGYTSRLSIIRSLAGLDCHITVIVMVFHRRIGRFLRFEGGKPVDCHSKYVNRVIYCYAKGEEELIHILLQQCSYPYQKVLLIPDSDFSASVIDKNQERLKDSFIFPHIHHFPGAVDYWMNKSVQKELARRIGLNVAEGQIVTVKDGHYSFPQTIQYPCFTKPLATVSGGKQFLKRCNSEEDLRSTLDSISQITDTKVLIEDYKEINSEYAVVGFSDGKEVVIPGVIEFIVNSLSHKGIAREGVIKPINRFEELISKFKLYVREIGYCGLFDIDFYESAGKFYFCEMNLRFGGSGFAYTAMGVNLPEMFVRFFNGAGIEAVKKEITETATYVNERMCIDDWVAGAISRQEMYTIINKANIRFVYDDVDPGPQRKLNHYIKGQAVKKLLKRWLCKK